MSWVISLNKLFASVRLIEMWPPPDSLSLRNTTPLLGSGFPELRKWRFQCPETATGLWSSACLLVVLERSSAVLWCMSVLQFQTSWLNPLTLCLTVQCSCLWKYFSFSVVLFHLSLPLFPQTFYIVQQWSGDIYTFMHCFCILHLPFIYSLKQKLSDIISAVLKPITAMNIKRE